MKLKDDYLEKKIINLNKKKEEMKNQSVNKYIKLRQITDSNNNKNCYNELNKIYQYEHYSDEKNKKILLENINKGQILNE